MRQRPTFLLGVLAVMVLLVPTASAGQEPATLPLANGLRVRVLAVDSTMIWGRLQDRTEDAIMVRQSAETEPTRIARDEILRMWRDDGDQIWLGGAVGGVVGVVIGHLYARQFRPSIAGLGIPILGGVAGFGAGFAIGAFVTKWVPVPF